MENESRTSIDETVEYYNQNAITFIDSTIDIDMSSLYEDFEALLMPECKLLDLGCGSGRDSRYFSEKGYKVIAIDPASAMCEQTRAYAHVQVYKMKAEEMQFLNEFDAVWACASLLHIARDEQENVLRNIEAALKDGGILYGSWKYGNHDRINEGRGFTDMNEDLLRDVIKKAPMLQEEKIWTTQDVRKDRRSQKWLNALIRKVQYGGINNRV